MMMFLLVSLADPAMVSQYFPKAAVQFC